MSVSLTPQQRSYLDRRRRLTRTWPWVGGLMLVALAAMTVWLYLDVPLLVNPFLVADRLTAGTLERGTLEVMAAILPIVFLGCLVLVAGVLLFVFQAMRNERRLLALVDRCLPLDEAD